MIRDVYLEALRQYERDTAPAYEVIRRARSRLRDQVVGPLTDSIDDLEDPFWAGDADPTEPNGAEIAVEAALEQPEPGKGPLAGIPEVSEHPAPASPRKPKKETFLCSRCQMPFKTRGWRDRHERKHPPVPDVSPAGGQRIRRTPPGFQANGGGA